MVRRPAALIAYVDNLLVPPKEGEKSRARFADEDEEIDPIQSIPEQRPEDMSPEAREQIKNLAMTLQKSRIQENRMSNFAYEPVSMPPSRVRKIPSFRFLPF